MDLEKATLVELRQLVKEKGIKNASKLKKDELIKILKDEKNEKAENDPVDRLGGGRNRLCSGRHSCLSEISRKRSGNPCD